MGNKKANKGIRRAASFLAVLGVLVMSSGVALMATATSANAAPSPKVVVCKYVGTPGGNLHHIVIVSENTLQNTGYVAPPPASWTEAHGQSTVGSIAIRYANPGEHAHDIAKSECPSETVSEPTEVTAAVDFVDPSCDNGNVAAANPVATEGVTYETTSGSAAAGGSIEITASAASDDFVLTNEDPVFSHTFPAAADCSEVTPPVVSPPVVSPPKKHHTTTVTPTVVHAGLAGATVQDMRGEQGLALMFAGMVMLVAAGGLGLRLRGAASRI